MLSVFRETPVVIVVGAPSVVEKESLSVDAVVAIGDKVIIGGTVVVVEISVVIGGAVVVVKTSVVIRGAVVVGEVSVGAVPVVVLIGKASVTLIRHPRFRWEAHCIHVCVCACIEYVSETQSCNTMSSRLLLCVCSLVSASMELGYKATMHIRQYAYSNWSMIANMYH